MEAASRRVVETLGLGKLRSRCRIRPFDPHRKRRSSFRTPIVVRFLQIVLVATATAAGDFRDLIGGNGNLSAACRRVRLS